MLIYRTLNIPSSSSGLSAGGSTAGLESRAHSSSVGTSSSTFAALCAFFPTASPLLTFLRFVSDGLVEVASDGVALSLALSWLLSGGLFSNTCLSSTAALAFSVNFGTHLLVAEATQGRPRTNHHTRDSERKGRIGLDCLSINPKRARMGSLLVLDCTLYILEYMWAARGYP